MRIIIAVVSMVILVAVLLYVLSMDTNTKKQIKHLTNKFLDAVVVHHNPDHAANCFCDDGSLFGTVSQKLRTGCEIVEYFDYFVHIPGIENIRREFNITKVANNVWLNSAFVTWNWTGMVGPPIVARMSFIFKGNCIYQLHSSVLPEANAGLRGLN